MRNSLIRPRRNRVNSSIRNLVAENRLTVDDLIAPLFLVEDKNAKIAIDSMPGQFRFGLNSLLEQVGILNSLGVNGISLFPALDDSKKDKMATESHNPDHFYQIAIKEIKQKYPDILIMTDVAMDPYSSDGHDGIVDSNSGEILNDETLEVLAKMAVTQARSGSDIIGPSDMMDGRVGVIREALDQEGFKNTLIMSYTAKYCSGFYGPFRDALDSAPKAGDKKTYQMNPANRKEALLEAKLDIAEGADILMVKPGLPYLDIIRDLAENTHLPIAAYNVSGEFAMIKAASERGWLDYETAMMEALLSFKRAGTDMILSYHAEDAAKILNS